VSETGIEGERDYGIGEGEEVGREEGGDVLRVVESEVYGCVGVMDESLAEGEDARGGAGSVLLCRCWVVVSL